MSLVTGRLQDPSKIRGKSAKNISLSDLVQFKNVNNPNEFIEKIQDNFSEDFHKNYEFDRIIEKNNKIYYVYKKQDKSINKLNLNHKNADFWYDPEKNIFISTNKRFVEALPALIKNTIKSRQAA